MKLSYITIYTKDVQAMREWYSTKLQLRVLSEARDAVILAGEGGGAALEIRKGRGGDEHPEPVRLAFQVEDVSVVFKRMYDGGIPFLGGPQKSGFGRSVATLKDPAGNVVELFSLENIKA